jgi:hypothetical protein
VKKKPRVVYVERGVVTRYQGSILEMRPRIGYTRENAPKGAPLLTKEDAQLDAHMRGCIAEFRRIQ